MSLRIEIEGLRDCVAGSTVKVPWDHDWLLKKLDAILARTDDAVRSIRAQKTSGFYTNSRLGALHGVSAATISYVVNRRSWRHVA